MVPSVTTKTNEKQSCFTVNSPLDKGLKSKVYWCVFLNSSNGYQVAKLIYGIADYRKGKIYQNLQDLHKLGYLRREDRIYHAEIRKIVGEIDNFLQNNKINLNDEEKEILVLFLECRIVKDHLRLTTTEIVQNGNTTVGGFLADLFTRLALMAISEIDHSGLRKKKPDLREECRKLNQIINEKELSIKPYTVNELFNKKLRMIENQYFKELKNYSNDKQNSDEGKRKTSKISKNLIFNLIYINVVFSLLPKDLLEKLKFLNFTAGICSAYMANRIKLD